MDVTFKEICSDFTCSTALEKESKELKIDFKIYLSEFQSVNRQRDRLFTPVEDRLFKIKIDSTINPRISGIEKKCFVEDEINLTLCVNDFINLMFSEYGSGSF
jgi:hypothetical protein